MRILYAEDNQANIFFMRRVAKVGHHEVINFIDGDSILKKFDQIKPDLVLMDIQLSGEKTGLDVVRELRRRGIDTPIIAVTAYAMVGDEERCLAAGCNAYLAKPLPVDKLVELFRQFDPANRSTEPKEVPPQPESNPLSDTETVARMIVNSAIADAQKIIAAREAAKANGTTPEEDAESD